MERERTPEYIEKVRKLNDECRSMDSASMALWVFTDGARAWMDEGDGRSRSLYEAVRDFSDFNPGNDPHKEHDFGSFELEGQDFNWKIDYFDLDLKLHSPDKSDPLVTIRVLTVMLVREY